MSRILKTAAVLAAMLVANLAIAHEFKIKDFELIHPWTREPARGVKDVPIYMVLRNTASTPDRIVAASSPFASRGELRAGKAEGGAQIGAIPIPANSTVELNADGAAAAFLTTSALPQEPARAYRLGSLTIEAPWIRATPAGARVCRRLSKNHQHGRSARSARRRFSTSRTPRSRFMR
jgi:copper(I)-binding protein